ncbi:MAG: GatB/YqeY domain-containing protein [Candidatus Abyssubacteria bacterium]|nr:GatB/YqeY domain-containing protein [Candidatus Abyssubacteria bacterium]
MTIKEKVESAIKEAMKNKDRERLSALRMIKAELLLKEKETEKGLDDSLADQALRKMFNKYRKAREEYVSLGKQEEVDHYARDIEVIESFMSAPMMSEEQVRQALEALEALVDEPDAAGPKDFGKVMKSFMSEHSNADGKVVSSILRGMLGKR